MSQIIDINVTPTIEEVTVVTTEFLTTINVNTINGGGIQSVQAGANVSVDNTDPLNPIVSASGGTFTPSDYDLEQFTNESADPFVRVSEVPSAPVQSVNGQIGNVVLNASNVGAPSGSGTSTGTNTGDETTATIQAKRPIRTVNGNSLEGVENVQVGTVTGSGTINTIPIFTPNGTSLGNSRIVQISDTETRVTNPVEPTRGVSFHPIVNIIFRLFRNQSRIDFSLGNPDASTENIISTQNSFGTAISSSGYLRFLVNQTTSQTAVGVTEALRLLPTGQIQITQPPTEGTTADALLVRNEDGSIRQIPTSAIGGGGGSTNLSYTASPTNGTVESDTGTDATIPLADATNAGLLSPAEKTTISALPLIIADATPSALVTASGVSTLVKTYNIGALNGRKILRFNIRAVRTLTGANARITVSLRDTVTNTVVTVNLAQTLNTARTIFNLRREIPLDQTAGVMRIMPFSTNTDDGEFTTALTNQAINFTNPLELRVELLDSSASVSIQTYQTLIELI